jgi:hypothetical protein
MKTLRFRLTELSQPEVIDEGDDLLQSRLDDWLTRSGRSKAQDGALPQILVTAFSNRDIKLVRNPRLDSLQDTTLAL